MKENHRKAILKSAAENPGFFNHAQNWATSLFDGKQGTSQPHFDNMMKTQGAQDFKASWDAFTKSSGDWLKSLQDGKTGTSSDAFKAMYSGKGAPWAWGLTGLTAMNMAGSFDNPITRTAGNVNQVVSAVNGILPWALGYVAYNKLGGLINKWAPTVKSGIKAWNDTKAIREFRNGPGAIESFGSWDKTTKYIQNLWNARNNVLNVRSNPEAAKNIIDATRKKAELTGDWDSHREALAAFGTSDDEFVANNGVVKSLFTHPEATLDHIGRNYTPDLGSFFETSAELSADDYSRLNAAMRTGRINGSMPVFTVNVQAPEGVDTFGKQRNMTQQLYRSGALNEAAYNTRMSDIAKRQREYNQKMQAYNNAQNAYFASMPDSGYERPNIAPPTPPHAPEVRVSNRTTTQNANNTRTFSDGLIKIKNAKDLSKINR